jgi:hypothetical protein
MQKSLAVLALIFLPLLLIGFASVGLADELIVKPSKPGEWILYDATDQEVATLALVEDGAYSIRPKGGQYLGIIRANGDLQMTGRHPVMSPSDAQLYLDAVDAIKGIK